MDYVMNSMDDDEDIEPATDEEALVMAEKLNDRRVLLAAFLKLIMYQVIETKMAAPIWGYLISVSRCGLRCSRTSEYRMHAHYNQ